MRPGNLNGVNYWFGGGSGREREKYTKKELKEKRALSRFSRGRKLKSHYFGPQIPAGQQHQHFVPCVYAAKHPLLQKKPLPNLINIR